MTIDKLTYKFSRIEPIEIDKKFEIGDEATIMIKAEVIQHIIGSNQDGTANLCAVFKPLTIELIWATTKY